MLKRFSPLLVLCTFLAACAGGGSTSPAAPSQTSSSSASAPQSVTISIEIPSATSASALTRRPLYVSAHTGSASIAVNGGTPVISNLTAGSTNCPSAAAGSARTCTVSVNAPAGTDSFVVALYPTTNGTGAVLSQNSITSTIKAGVPNTVSITLDGVVASIVLALAKTNPPTGTATSTTLTVNLLDASGAAIVGNDALANPVTLTDSDNSATAIVPKTTLSTPADATGLSVTYSGATLSQAVFSATASGLSAANVTAATLTPQAQSNPTTMVDWPTYGYDSQRTGFNPSTTALTPSSISKLHLGWKTNNGGGSQTQPIIATNVAGHTAVLIVAGYPSVQAYDALTGVHLWSTTVQKQFTQECGNAGVAGTAQYDRSLNAIFIAAGNGAALNHVILYRLDAATGNVTGTVDVTPILLPGEATLGRTAVTLANGKLYLGTSSSCEGAATGPASWRGRVVAVDPASMTLLNTFYTTYGQGGNYGGGGVWAWGGVSVDPSGNVYTASGNAETNLTIQPQTAQAPFVQTDNEQAGFAEHLVKISGDLSTPEDSNYPGFNFKIGYDDLDYAGTPVLYQPPLGSGCGLLSATQGKGGTLVINNTAKLSPALNTFALSIPSAAAFYIGNPGYSPNTGYLYAPISSAGNGSSLLPPGMAAIGGCGSSIVWHTTFGPDSVAFGDSAHPSRTAPTATAGGVVFMGTPCTPDGNGGCTTPNPSKINGAIWAVDASSGELLGGGKPILVTGDTLHMAPSADGQWIYVMDLNGNIYGLTIDPSVPTVSATVSSRHAQQYQYHAR